MKILPATLEDIQDLDCLVQSGYSDDKCKTGWTSRAGLVEGSRITPEILKTYIFTPNVTILKGIDDKGKIIGCVYTKLENDNKLKVEMFCVRPDLQDRGYGKQLISAVDDLAKEKGCPASKMIVISARTELVEYYLRRGYRKTGKSEPFPGGSNGKALVPLECIVLEKEY